ncbi:MAG: heme exporter protein CcmB [Selenomonadaceae bacterium]|nr:heme exporter protein CcmB [Selenomonadaceae bacterium]
MKLSNFLQAAAIFHKDFLVGLRRRAAFAAMAMFSLTAIASMSLSVGGILIEPKLLAALLWVVIFFAAGAGISGTFEDEAAAGTLATLKLYAAPQAVLFGKMAFTLASLLALTIFLLPVFLILFDAAVAQIFLLLATILLGLTGIAAAGTLTAALTVSASTKGGLFPILLFPVTLPIFLPAISLTEAALTGAEFAPEFLLAMIFYDAILTVASSILYDFLD